MRAACNDQLGQRRLHALEIGQTCPNIRQACRSKFGGLIAVGAVLQPEQLRDLVQAEPQSLR